MEPYWLVLSTVGIILLHESLLKLVREYETELFGQ